MKRLKFAYADDEKMLHMLKEVCLKSAFETSEIAVDVIHLYDGKELVDYATTQEIDGIVTDIDMPFMNGLEVLTNLNQSRKLKKALVVSGKITPERVSLINSLGVDHIVKPYTMGEFIEKLRKVWPEYSSR